MQNLRPLIEQRIKTNVSGFKEVAGASDLASLLKGRLSDTGCYVFQERDVATENKRINSVIQRNVEQYAVVIVIRNVRDPRGADAADVCYTFRKNISQFLLGWVPHVAAEQLEYAGGTLVSFQNGLYIWKASYRTAQFLESV